jgi:Tc toxin complex TcA C-terminal TcB-binding domain/Neuraminidase-like domain/Salmonella virulence plasmid 28.1kDa A protein
MAKKTFTLKGTIVSKADKKPIEGLRVEAWDKDLLIDDLVGSAVTNKTGKFEIKFDSKYYSEIIVDRRPDIFFKVFKGDKLVADTANNVLWNISDPETIITIEVEMQSGNPENCENNPSDPDITNSKLITIRGTVSTDAMRLPAHLLVQIVNQDLFSEKILGAFNTDCNGKYEGSIQVDCSQSPAIKAKVMSVGSTTLAESTIIYSITDPIQLDIFIPTSALPRVPEFFEIQTGIAPLLGTSTIEVLSQQQMSLLAGKSKFPGELLKIYQQAFQVAADEKLSAELLYGMFRKGLPVKLAALYGQNTLDLRRMVSAAVLENIIGPQDEKTVTALLEKLQRSAIDAVLSEPLVIGGAAFGTLLQSTGVTESVTAKFIDTYHKNTDSVREFWKKLESGQGGIATTDVAKLKFGVQAGSLSLGHLPMTQSLVSLKNEGRISDMRSLASWSTNQWEEHITSAEKQHKDILPASVPGDTTAEKKKNYARAMSRIMEQNYPTEFIAGKISQDSAQQFSLFPVFAANNERFVIGETNIDQYLTKNKNALNQIENKELFVKDLKSFQLQYMLSPGFDRYESVGMLQNMNVKSSSDVLSMQWKDFSASYQQQGGSVEMAGTVYDMATHNVAMMQNFQMTYSADFGPGPYVTTIPHFWEFFPTVFEGSPDLSTLFGSQDYCECKHCHSIYGPAAYLVDLLQFIKKASATAASSFENALEVLFDRRPDICYIDLNCDNALIALPYIDLVNEIFENAVYQQTSENIPDFSEYQTVGTTQELLAHPEHIRDEVYTTTLKNAVYPWQLPLDLWTEEGRVYLEHLKIPRYKVMDAFYNGTIGQSLLDETGINEVLRLSVKDRTIILGTSGDTNNAVWGLTGAANLVTTLQKVTDFLYYSGLEYEDLKELLKTRFLNPTGTIQVDFDPENPCNLDYATITPVNESWFMNVLRFCRLSIKLNWKFRDLDTLLTAFGASTITADILKQISHAIRLTDYVKLSIHQIASLWGNIYTGHVNYETDERSPYQQLFLNKAVLNPVDTAFNLNTTLTELAVVGVITDHSATIKAGISISSADMDMLVAEALPDTNLNLANLSELYRHTVLAKALKISIDDLLALIDISGINPFDASATHNTILLAYYYKKIKKSKFKIAELNYLFYKDYDISYGYGLSEDKVSELLTDLQAGLKKITDENQFVADPQGELTTLKLSNILSEEDHAITISILEGTSALSEADQGAFITASLDLFLLDPTDAIAQLVTAGGSLTEKQERYEYVLEDLLNYLIEIGSREYLKQKTASSLGIPTEVVEALLFDYIKGPDDTTLLAGEILLDESFVTSENEEILLTDFPDQFNTWILLHKTSSILRKFKVTELEIDCLFANAFDPEIPGWPGWFEFNSLPVIADGTPSTLLGQLIRLCDLFGFYHSLPASDDNLFDIMLDAFDPASTTTITDLLSTISDLTKWDLENLTELNDNVFAYSKTSYADEIPFMKLQSCMSILTTTGASAVDAKTWVTVELTSAVSHQIVHAVKSLYSEKEWLSIARPLRDLLREKQRSSLMYWLIFNQSGIDTSYQLYAYYLIDPEMSACMLTSRLRLALSSVQLFIQRCQMNLEEDVEISNEDQEHWAQWKWMKTYRLWEANRKVFCYPENWIEPELRDNKTEFFEQLEQELEQSDITDESAEVAYINYLSKLESVSNMDMMGICGIEDKYWGPSYYVFGRTTGKPNLLYFRKYDEGNKWDGWQKIDIDFEGDHLIPIMYNNKLYIFWPVFTTQTKEAEIPNANQKGSEPSKYREIQMAWTVYANGKWSAKRVSEEMINELLNERFSGSNNQYNDGVKRFFTSKNIDSQNNLSLTVYERKMTVDFTLYKQIGAFTFNPSMKITVTATTNEELWLDTVDNSYVMNQEFLETAQYSWMTNNGFSLANGVFPLLAQTPDDYFSVTFIENDGYAAVLLTPFLYQDNGRTFLGRITGSGIKFATHYHPYVSDFMNAVSADGVAGLLNPEYNSSDSDALSNGLRRQQISEEFFESVYGAKTSIVNPELPIEEIDFSLEGAYATYNWELFFHIPMLIADKLSDNQRFDEAQKWYHYIFDPTDNSTEYSVPQRFWKLKPFMEVYDEAADGTPASILELMNLLNAGDDEMEAQVEAWRDDPFNPHLIARMRISAYQKNVVMKYIDNLLKWGDMLFRQDTMETTNEATQLYLLAWNILGEKPTMVEGEEPDDMNYCELSENGIDDFSNSMVELETILIKYFGTKHKAGFGKFKDSMLKVEQKAMGVELYKDNKLWFTNPVSSGSKMGQAAYSKTSNSILESENSSLNYYKAVGNNRVSASSTDMVSTPNSLELLKSPQYTIRDLVKNGYTRNDVAYTHPKFIPAEVYQVIKTLYFCIPENDKLMDYWNIVEDRMYKLRNCLNIEGVFRQLPLFDPPIDPGMLVKAVASGMSLSSALNDLNASLPNYRFVYTIEKAKEFVNVVKILGATLLSALEKKDAEGLALLRAGNEIELLEAIKQVKKYQLEEAQHNRNALAESAKMVGDKFSFYNDRERRNTAEDVQVGLMWGGIGLQIASNIISIGGSIAYGIPQVTLGAAGWAASPFAVVEVGGQQAGNTMIAIAKGLNDLASTMYQGASLSGIMANIQRRSEDWDFMRDQAETEKVMVEKQQEAALTRYKIAQTEIDNHDKQIEQREAEYEFMKSKFTNKELYDWMIGQLATVYFQAYQMAFDLSKRAERSYKFELADTNDSFLSYGYWDSLKKGLLSGDKLHSDLMRMEASYIEKNKRTYELTKHVSLSLTNPFALLQLKENGLAYFDIPEELLDIDHPGQYMRRIKSVSVTIPCIAGPYSGVNAKLTLLSNSIRKTPEVDTGDLAGSYPKRTDGTEDRFIENIAMIQSIATSTAQNDSGLFTLDFRDERYLPFEGAGAISSWQLELPGMFRSFDYNTISDAIITINYTAKDGGSILSDAAEAYLTEFTESSADEPAERLISMKQEFSSEWYAFFNQATGTDQSVDIKLPRARFQHMYSERILHITGMDIIMQLKDASLYDNSKKIELYLTPSGGSETTATLTANTSTSSDLYVGGQPVNLGLSASFTIEDDSVALTVKAKETNLALLPEELRTEIDGHTRINKDAVDNIFIVLKYYVE